MSNEPGWHSKPFREVASITTGSTPSKTKTEFYGGKTPFVTVAELGNHAYVTSAPVTLTDSGVKSSRAVQKNSVLVCCIGSIGKVGIAGEKLVTNQQINALTFDEDIVYYKYGYYFCRTIKNVLKGMAPSTTIGIVNKTRFSEIKIPLPPLPEQKRIASILDKADAIRRKRKQALDMADEFLRATFLDMFGDPVTNPKGWEEIPMLNFFDFTTGQLDSNAAIKGGKYPFFTCSRETFAIDTFAFNCEALLLAGNNAAGKYSVKHYSGKFNAYQRTYVITLRNNDNFYTYAKRLLKSKLNELQHKSIGSSTKYLTMALFNRLKVQVPPLPLQDEFDKLFKNHTKVSNKLQIQAANSEDLFASLSQKAFKGEL